jgi:hypothetical protein
MGCVPLIRLICNNGGGQQKKNDLLKEIGSSQFGQLMTRTLFIGFYV